MNEPTQPPSSGQGAPGFITGPDGTIYQAMMPPGAAMGAQNVSGERHVSSVAGNSTFDRKKGATILTCAVAAAVAFIVLRPKHQHPDPNQQAADAMQVRQIAKFEPPPLPRPEPAAFRVPLPPLAAPPALPTQRTTFVNPMSQKPADTLAKARHAALFVYSVGGASSGAQAASTDLTGGAVSPSAAGPTSLSAHLQGTPLTGVTASVLHHQPYLLTEGTIIPCVLQTAMDSTLPGFVTCLIPQNVIGKTGITLLDRGTKVFGEFQGGIRQGQSRLFVLWTRAETPSGVIINLDSPGDDPLGRSGFDGAIDTHFWARFGGALLLTLVQGGLQAGTALASSSGTTSVNTGGEQSVASTALANSINIQPTLRKNQGEMVSIMVARDLDFSTVYQVMATAGAPLSLTGASYP